MTITYHTDVKQYTPEWEAVKCGVLSASKIEVILTDKKLEFSGSKECKALVDFIAMQRVTGKTDETFQSYDMRRGLREEEIARQMYAESYSPVVQCGFVTNDKWGFKIGCSPDWLIDEPTDGGAPGGAEAKSRLKKLQFGVVRSRKMPEEFRFQVQTSMMVTERPWWDFVSYSGDFNMMTVRVLPDLSLQRIIEDAAFKFEALVTAAVEEYGNALADGNIRILPTKPTPDEDDIISSSDEQEAA
jgi:hypothetical protein